MEGRPQSLAEFLETVNLSDSVPSALGKRKLNRRSGVLAGLLAAGVSSLRASNLKAPAELQDLARKQVDSLLASNPLAAAELEDLARKVGASQRASNRPDLYAQQRAAGRSRMSKLTPEERREHSRRMNEARRRKREAL